MLVAVIIAAVAASAGARAAEAPPLRLPDVLAEVRRANPELEAARKLAGSAAARPASVGGWADPMVMLEWWQQPVDFSVVPIMVTVRQTLPLLGMTRARRTVAEREAATAAVEASALERRLLTEAKRAFLDAALAERNLAVNERLHAVVASTVAAADAKYRAGRAVQAELLRAQEELLTLDNERLDFERARDEAHARLRALLGRDGDAPLGVAELPPPPTIPPAAELLARAVAASRELARARAAVAEAEARREVARRENRPEVTLWASYMVNAPFTGRGTDTFTVGASTTLPIFSSLRRRPALSAADAEIAARKAAVEAVRRRVESEVRTALLQIESARRHVVLHVDKMIPLAELALESAQAAYAADRTPFSTLLEAARAIRMHHSDHYRFAVDLERRVADLELAVGEELPRDEVQR
jgi:outer membrane protein TolC